MLTLHKMELFGFNEWQWLILTINLSGIFFTIGKYICISDTIDYFDDDDLMK